VKRIQAERGRLRSPTLDPTDPQSTRSAGLVSAHFARRIFEKWLPKWLPKTGARISTTENSRVLERIL